MKKGRTPNISWKIIQKRYQVVQPLEQKSIANSLEILALTILPKLLPPNEGIKCFLYRLVNFENNILVLILV